MSQPQSQTQQRTSYAETSRQGAATASQSQSSSAAAAKKDDRPSTASSSSQSSQSQSTSNTTSNTTATTSSSNKQMTKQEYDEWKSTFQVVKDTRVRTEDVKAHKDVTWDDFGLKLELLKGIYEYGYETPSPVQIESIPKALAGKDILARAKNGTGKTASYIIPILDKIDTSKSYVQAVVLVPSRELTLQSAGLVKHLGKYLKVNVVPIIGGTSLADDILKLKQGAHVVVATAGRLIDLCVRNALNLRKCEMIVLDEADKLLTDDTGLLVDRMLQEFCGVQYDRSSSSYQPLPGRQIWCFSATFPLSVGDFRDRWMRDAVEINLMDELTLKGVTQYYVYVDESKKVIALRSLVLRLNINQAMVFCNSVIRCELLCKKVTEIGFSCFFMHSKMPQEDRNRIFHDFRSGHCRMLVCTDLCTRGIDVPTVNVVINFDFPSTSETYLHRIGRSGRFGHLGLAINLITEADKNNLFRIERELGTTIEPCPQPQDIDQRLYCI